MKIQDPSQPSIHKVQHLHTFKAIPTPYLIDLCLRDIEASAFLCCKVLWSFELWLFSFSLITLFVVTMKQEASILCVDALAGLGVLEIGKKAQPVSVTVWERERVERDPFFVDSSTGTYTFRGGISENNFQDYIFLGFTYSPPSRQLLGLVWCTQLSKPKISSFRVVRGTPDRSDVLSSKVSKISSLSAKSGDLSGAFKAA
jgi:hypothetical protein